MKKSITENTDCIQIENIRVAGKHGVSAIERDACLPLRVDISLDIDLRKAELSDELSDTVNYSSVRKQVVEIIERTSHKLLEKLAGAVIEELFTDSRIVAISIKISKPERLDGATPSVTLVRANPATGQRVREK